MSAHTLDEHLATTAARRPQAEAVVTPSERVTYGELDRRATALAAALRARGIGAGDRVAVVEGNDANAVVAIYGVARAGAAFVPLSPSLRPHRLGRVLRACGAAAAVCDARGAHRIYHVDAPELRHVLTTDAAASRSAPSTPRVLDVDLATVLYTSGSTGEPKGAAFLHRNVDFVAGSMIQFLQLDDHDRVLSVLPLFHTYGLYQLIMTVRVGATLVLRQGMGLPGELVRTLRRESISVLPGVPTMWHVLTTFAPDGGRLLPRLRLLTNAGAAMPAARLERLRAAFPSTDVIPIYGQTECKSACYLPSGEVDIRPGSVGVALPGTAVRLVGNDGGPVRHGEVGELYIRGDHVMQGYWNDVEATARALVPSRLPGDRELRSGDLFRADADGFMYFVARKDDIIISRGEKVAPREVEDVLLAAPGVRDVAVVGVPDELRGAAVVAFVSPEAGQVLDPDLLRRKCAEHLEDHQMPVAVHVLDALPRLDTGKIDRVALVARATAPRLPVRPRARTLTQVVPQPSKHLSRVGVSEHAAET